MFGFIGNIGPWELAFILIVALIVVGPGKLPEVAKSLGKAVNEFKRSTSGMKKEFEDAMRFDDPPVVKPQTSQIVSETETEADNKIESTESEAEKKPEGEVDRENDSVTSAVN